MPHALAASLGVGSGATSAAGRTYRPLFVSPARVMLRHPIRVNSDCGIQEDRETAHKTTRRPR
jgi:hypothetical protein